jgi:membrane protease YdiL (CAAX protease family)
MTTEAQFGGGGEGELYRAPVPIPALARFVIAALWTAGVFWASGFVYALFPGRNLIPDLLFRVIACVLTAGGYVFLLRVLDYNHAPTAKALGLPGNWDAGENFASGLALGGLLIAGDVGAIACLGSVQFQFHLSRHLVLRSAAVAVLLLFGALLEELSFRGYPFQKLTQACGGFWAVVILSALFGALHLGNPDSGGWLSWSFFNTLAVGVVFALARIRSGSLWFSFGLHFGWNLFQGAIFGLPVSGLHEFASLVTASAHGSVAVTGGDYGPEASAVCSVVLVASVPLVWWLTARKYPAQYS